MMQNYNRPLFENTKHGGVINSEEANDASYYAR